MKRLFILCMILGILLSLSVHALATEMPLEMLDTQAKPGQPVYLAVTLNASVTAKSMAVKCEFDKTLLTALPDYSTWGKEGLLSAFQTDNIGVWATENPVDMKGKLFVLAFQVKEGVTFPYTTVKCTVVLKNGDEEVGNYTVEGSITSDCTHSYGNWQSAGKMNHVRICALCGLKNSQNHQWGEPTQTKTDHGTTLQTKICQVCREQNILEISDKTGEIKPVEPSDTHTHPSAPGQTLATQPAHSHPSTPTQKPAGQTDPTSTLPQGTLPHGTLPHDHEHTPTTPGTKPSVTQPAHDHTHATVAQSDHADHDHPTESNNPAALWMLLALIVLTLTGLTIFVKKKH